MLKETCLMHAILMRMRGGEIIRGRRRKYRRNEDKIEQFKANYMQDQITVRWRWENVTVDCKVYTVSRS